MDASAATVDAVPERALAREGRMHAHGAPRAGTGVGQPPFPRLALFARRISGLGGWRRIGLALLLGVAATAALPPVHVLPCLVLAFTGLAWLVEGSPGIRHAAWTGWWFGLGHFTSGLYWVALAFLTDPERYGLLAPFAPMGLGALMAIYPAFAAGFACALTRLRLFESPSGRVLALGIAWGVSEWLRGHTLTGFPWNLIAYSWAASDPMTQTAAVIGSYGLGVVTVAVMAAPAALAAATGTKRRALGPVIAAALVVAALWAGGAARLAAAGPPMSLPMVSGVGLRLVQPDIAQEHKWREDLRLAHLARHLEMSKGPGPTDKVVRALSPDQRVTDIIWPETAAPFLVDQDNAIRAVIAGVVPRNGLVITGAPRATKPGEEPFRVWNSVVAVNDIGEVQGVYDKFHLVPFGEYLPLRSLIPSWLPVEKLTPGNTDFSRGPGPRTLVLPGLPPAGPLICYEIIFPGDVLDPTDRPAWLLNLTNDGWFGISSGPYQHFAAARLRAVEEGIPVVRAANTGISAIIDPYGRVLAGLGLGDRGVIEGPLPKPLARETRFAWLGDGALVLMLAAATLLAALAARAR
jgi:apolipoprotein N-acyltransferase